MDWIDQRAYPSPEQTPAWRLYLTQAIVVLRYKWLAQGVDIELLNDPHRIAPPAPLRSIGDTADKAASMINMDWILQRAYGFPEQTPTWRLYLTPAVVQLRYKWME